MKKRKLFLSIVIPVLLSGIELLSHIVRDNTITTEKIIIGWLTGSLFLFILWHANQYAALKTEKSLRLKGRTPVLLLQTSITIVLITTFIAIENLLVPANYRVGANVPLWFTFLRFFIGSVIIVTIQNTLLALEQNQAIKLANATLLNENLEARLQSLKQQINPHFLFNALSTLRTMVRSNDESAEKFIINLSEVYRQLLNKSDAATITLSDEIEFLKSYVFMLEARFEKNLHIQIQTLPGSTNMLLPAFSLQLLVENCTKHNIISSAKPLFIKIYQQNESSITIENNLQLKPSSAETSSGIGINNLKKRYALLNVNNGVSISITESTYTVNLKLL